MQTFFNAMPFLYFMISRTQGLNHRISVIIPTYNEEENIGNTLRELRKLLPTAEFIVADGRSTDNTVKIAKKLADRVVFEKLKPGQRGSIAGGRNAGAKASKNSYLLFCDADNVPPKGFYSRMIEEFEKPEVVGFGGKVIPKNATFIQRLVFEFFNVIVGLSVLFKKPSIAGNAAAYKKKPFFAVGGFDTSMQASEDQDLCQRISKKGLVVYDSKVVTFTSNRRLAKFGLMGLIWDWGVITLNFIVGKKTEHYELAR